MRQRQKAPSPVYLTILLLNAVVPHFWRLKRNTSEGSKRIDARIKDLYGYLYTRLLNGTTELPWEHLRESYRKLDDSELEHEF
jgi:hypothetical protein